MALKIQIHEKAHMYYLGSIEAGTSAESFNAVQTAQQLVGQSHYLVGQV